MWHGYCNTNSVTDKETNMKPKDTMEVIFRLFEDLSPAQKVETLSVLYYDLRDMDKDKFLRETENA